MGIVASREVLPRTVQHRIGEAPSAERRFVVTLDNTATPHQTVINAIGIGHGAAHPEYSLLAMTDATLTENAGSPYHIEVVYKYEFLSSQSEPNPLLRRDIWSFSVGGAKVPCVRYYDDGDVLKPLTNAARELIENQTTEEAEIRATITGNRASFPLQLAAYVTNTLNAGPYLGGRSYTWKCVGIGGQQQVEVVNDAEVAYYQITTELVYRASGWPLLLPDAGFNYLEDGERKRAWTTFRDKDGEETRVPTANAVALSASGKMLEPGSPPRILVRRVHRAVDFSQYFGSPTF
jgi:hypothetical protein